MKFRSPLLLSLMLLFSVGLFAQAPEGIPYQAVVRDGSGNLMASQSVSFQISILQTTSTGTAVYVETQSVTTNAYGLATFTIGGGTAVTGTLGGVDWSTGPYFLKVEVDPAGGTSYTDLGTTQLMSVPYALYAATGAGTPGATGATGPTGPAGSGSSLWTQSSDDIYYGTSTVGNVSIGTSNTNYGKLFIFGNNTNTTGDDGVYLSMNNNATNTGTTVGIRFGTTNNLFKSAILHQDNGTNGVGNLIFAATGDVGSTNVSAADAKLTINADGVGVGTTAPTMPLHVVGSAQVYAPGTVDTFSFSVNYASGTLRGIGINNTINSNKWTIYQYSSSELSLLYNASDRGSFNTTSGAYTSVSDARDKDNISPIGNVLNNVMQLQPKSYHFKSDETDKKYIGFIAQDVEKLFPQLVYHRDAIDGQTRDQYMLDYSGFGVVAIGAIQEQQKQIQDLQAENQQLRQELDAIKAQLGIK